MADKSRILINTYLVVGILSIILPIITLWEYVRGYGYLDAIYLILIIMGVTGGMLFLIAYRFVLKNKDYLGLVVMACILGLISSLWVIIGWIGLWSGGFDIQADILIFVISWILSIIYIIVLVMTVILIKNG